MIIIEKITGCECLVKSYSANDTLYNDSLLESCEVKYSSDVKYEIIFSKLEKLMSSKIFLDENLTVERAAALIGTNRTYLFYLFANILEMKFSTYLNRYRVEYANELLKEREVETQELIEICGFRSERAFIMAINEYRGDGLEFLKKRYLCKK